MRTHFSSLGDSAQDRIKSKARTHRMRVSAMRCSFPITTLGALAVGTRAHLFLILFASVNVSGTGFSTLPQWDDFYERLERCVTGETPFTLVRPEATRRGQEARER